MKSSPFISPEGLSDQDERGASKRINYCAQPLNGIQI